MRLLATDPGSEQRGFVEYDPDAGPIVEHGVVANEILLARCWRERDPAQQHHLAIEMVDVFGMAGRTVFETCMWIGRFIEAWGAEHYTKVTRHEVKMHLCHTKKRNDRHWRERALEWTARLGVVCGLLIGLAGLGAAGVHRLHRRRRPWCSAWRSRPPGLVGVFIYGARQQSVPRGLLLTAQRKPRELERPKSAEVPAPARGAIAAHQRPSA